jgi:hypothetical protein
MQKILINPEVGGFYMSLEAKEMYLKAKGIPYTIEDGYAGDGYAGGKYVRSEVVFYNLKRDDETLLKIYEEIGCERFSVLHVCIRIVEVPDDVEWIICTTDYGHEWVAEKHRTWFYKEQ